MFSMKLTEFEQVQGEAYSLTFWSPVSVRWSRCSTLCSQFSCEGARQQILHHCSSAPVVTQNVRLYMPPAVVQKPLRFLPKYYLQHYAAGGGGCFCCHFFVTGRKKIPIVSVPCSRHGDMPCHASHMDVQMNTRSRFLLPMCVSRH